MTDSTSQVTGPEPTMATGPAAAAMLAAGIGSFAMGLLAILSETVALVHDALPWIKSVGPLSGKVALTVIIWLVAWFILHRTYKGRNANITNAALTTAGLVALGIIMMLPPIWHLFSQ